MLFQQLLMHNKLHLKLNYNNKQEDLAGGLGDYQQYLNQAQQYSGPQAYQQFMSPYQQEVI
jgi:hypothetical protein